MEIKQLTLSWTSKLTNNMKQLFLLLRNHDRWIIWDKENIIYMI